MKIVRIGRVYKIGKRGEYDLVRVIRRDTVYYSVKGPRKGATPYNFAMAADLRRPSRIELQQFLEQMPL